MALGVDVSNEAALVAAIQRVEQALGPIELFLSNAGVGFGDGPGGLATSAANELWEKSWSINVMSQVYAARALLPGMIARGEGYLVNMASAAGLLSQIGDAAYSATKHAAVGFAEALAINHGDQGVKVSVVCPQYVQTPLLAGLDPRLIHAVGDPVMSAEAAARKILAGIRDERFLILTHPEAGSYFQNKADDYEGWIKAMRALRRSVT
jgi:NAD(P)-dependent dehydrogenase (short-subunit alcohol dehydrogenase family)